uniref:Uncharacterized protein n=1 Tax=Anguilla anguilla TaxID=7936 RepID=A0A0E9SQP1_ANGAN
MVYCGSPLSGVFSKTSTFYRNMGL